MIITKTKDGKLDIDLSNTEISVLIGRDVAGLNFIQSLFNWDVVESVRNGLWRFEAVKQKDREQVRFFHNDIPRRKVDGENPIADCKA